jgi:hypothetical protein
MSEPESTPPKEDSFAKLSRLLEGISKVAASEKQEALPDPEAVELALEGEDDLLNTGQAWLREEIRQVKHLHAARLVLLGALFVLVLLWLVSVGVLLLFAGFHSLISFDLSDKVIMTYITTTTASVLGLFIIAAKWLFSAQSIISRGAQQHHQ